MKSRVELMREAVADALAFEHPQAGAIAGKLEERSRPDITMQMESAVNRLAEVCRELDPDFYAEFDFEMSRDQRPNDRSLPAGLVFSARRSSQRIVLTWFNRSVVFCVTGKPEPIAVVPLGADDAGERLVNVLEMMITAFFDRSQAGR